MGRGAAGLVGVVLGAALVHACSTFDGKTNEPVAPPPDAAVETVDGSDTPRPEDAAIPDGGLPATCPPEALLCDGFERTTLRGPWDAVVGEVTEATPSDWLRIDEVAAAGARGLRSTPLAIAQRAVLYRNLPSQTQKLDMSFALRIDAKSDDETFVLTVDFVPYDRLVHLVLVGGELKVLEQNRTPPNDAGQYYAFTGIVAPVPLGTFTRFTFSVDARSRTVKLVQGTSTYAATLQTIAQPMVGVGLGTTFARTDAGLPHWFDDVAIVTSP